MGCHKVVIIILKYTKGYGEKLENNKRYKWSLKNISLTKNIIILYWRSKNFLIVIRKYLITSRTIWATRTIYIINNVYLIYICCLEIFDILKFFYKGCSLIVTNSYHKF